VGHLADALDVEHVVLRVGEHLAEERLGVRLRIAERHWSRSCGSSTKLTSMPIFGSV
jgi:hypothetical protein